MSTAVNTPASGDGIVPVAVMPPPGEVRYLPDILADVPGLFEVPVARRPSGIEFVYFLCHEGASPPGHPPALVVDYVGRTRQLPKRIADHEHKRRRDGMLPFERVYAVGLPLGASAEVEEALIRHLAPVYNAPRRTGVRERDQRALARLGISGVQAHRWDDGWIRPG